MDRHAGQVGADPGTFPIMGVALGAIVLEDQFAGVGQFARLGIQSAGRVPRRPDQAPWLYFAGTTYYLMELDGEWVIVNVSSWIT